ncbi:integrin beta-3-like protein [Lates japonicus]|uniref:Integrin beta-3-like protein n=1 Tax=Lates japonicus TaxID=270547 RepID=A0AAD3MXD4_LATJO|nr:integrin beta-3-like protein [Lates japonicus]
MSAHLPEAPGRLGPHTTRRRGRLYIPQSKTAAAPEGPTAICSGRGDCVQRQCVCHSSGFGKVWQVVKSDDFNCSCHKGNLLR